MDNDRHVDFCKEAHAHRLEGLTLSALMYKDNDGDLWVTIWDTTKGATILLPVTDETSKRIEDILDNFYDWLGMRRRV